MAVKHAVLGLVIEEPGYGAELERRFDSRLGFWRAAASVYPILWALKNEGLIRPVDGPGEAEGSDPEKVWYEATPEGRDVFERWMRGGINRQPPPLRSKLLMKLALTSGTPEELVQLHHECVRQEQWCVDRMNELDGDQDLELQLPNAPKDWPLVRDQLLLDAEHAHMTATVDYLSDIRRAAREAYERLTGRPLETP